MLHAGRKQDAKNRPEFRNTKKVQKQSLITPGTGNWCERDRIKLPFKLKYLINGHNSLRTRPFYIINLWITICKLLITATIKANFWAKVRCLRFYRSTNRQSRVEPFLGLKTSTPFGHSNAKFSCW